MAIVSAVKSGNWSDITVWSTGALPASVDTVQSNNFTVTVNGTFVVSAITNTGGGGFVFADGGDLTATLSQGGWGGTSLGYIVGFSLAAPATATFRGNITNTGSTSRDGRAFVLHSGTGTFNVVGNINCTTGYQDYIVRLTGTGILNLTGNIIGNGGSNGLGYSVSNASSGTINITGNVTGNLSSGAANDYTCVNLSNGTINITGTVTGNNGYGVINNSTGTVNITGPANGGAAYAFYANSAGNITHIGPMNASASSPAGYGLATAICYLSGPFVGTAQGVAANIATRWRWIPSVGSSYMTVVTSGAGGTATGYKNLYTADSTLSNSGQPGISSVRSGTIYGPNSELTGTMIVPATNTVITGVSVGNTVGTAVYPSPSDVWKVLLSDITTPGSIGERLKTAATVGTVNSILSNGLR
jgi:hypothetical protein